MNSGTARRTPLSAIIAIGSLILFGIIAALGLRSCTQLGVPASAGLPTPVPGIAQVVPTVGPSVPTLAPPGPAAVITPTEPLNPIVPTVVAVATTAPSVIVPGGVEPVPAGGQPGDSGGQPAGSGGFIDGAGTGADGVPADAVEPFPEGSRPTGASSGTTSGGSSGTTSGGGAVVCGRRVVYIVQPGDNLFRIALRYRTTSQAIARLNGIDDVRQISVGQRLVIVTCRQGGGTGRVTYVVQPGDNLFRIALRYGTTAAAIRAANGLYSNLIVPGQVLRIP